MSSGQLSHNRSIYRRRRITVLAGLIGLIVFTSLIVFRPGLGGTEDVEPVPAEILAEPESVVRPCSSAQVELTPVTNKARYNEAESPSLWLSIKNTGSSECELQVGTDVQEYTIDSGPRDNPDLIWSSTHCQSTGVPMSIVLQPGEERSTSAIVWDRTRSTASTCDSVRPSMPGGGASYHLSVKLGPFESDGTKQFLLD